MSREQAMNCEQAQQLFDAYLDGELSPSLATELGAHRLRCPDCRRALALLEVSGHVLVHDREPASLRADFAERLLSCAQPVPTPAPRRWVSRLYVLGPVAAAAVIVLAFLGLFDRGRPRVAGHAERRTEAGLNAAHRAVSQPATNPAADLPENPDDPLARVLDEWAASTQRSLEEGRERGASLQRLIDQKMSQVLDALAKPEATPAASPDAGPSPAGADPAEAEEANPPADEADPDAGAPADPPR